MYTQDFFNTFFDILKYIFHNMGIWNYEPKHHVISFLLLHILEHPSRAGPPKHFGAGWTKIILYLAWPNIMSGRPFAVPNPQGMAWHGKHEWRGVTH
jgi:hypothetical protein